MSLVVHLKYEYQGFLKDINILTPTSNLYFNADRPPSKLNVDETKEVSNVGPSRQENMGERFLPVV